MERDVTVNGVRLQCVVEGKGPLVLLLHGFPETSHAWRKQMPALPTRFQVVAPDLRGYGGSGVRASIWGDDDVALGSLLLESSPSAPCRRARHGARPSA